MRRNREGRALLEHEADIRAQETKYSELAIETGYSELYVANYVARRVREKRQKVDVSLKPRRFSHTDEELGRLAELMRGK